MYTDPVYKVVDYDNNISLPNFFDTFSSAMKACDEWKEGYGNPSVECLNGDTSEIMYTRGKW